MTTVSKAAKRRIAERVLVSNVVSRRELVGILKEHGFEPDAEKLVEQAYDRVVNGILSRIKDDNGVRIIFAADKKGEYVNIDRTTCLVSLAIVQSNLSKQIEGLEASLMKVGIRREIVERQLTLEEATRDQLLEVTSW